MMNTLTDKKFLIGCAVGFFIVPMVSKHVRSAVEGMRSKAGV